MEAVDRELGWEDGAQCHPDAASDAMAVGSHVAFVTEPMVNSFTRELQSSQILPEVARKARRYFNVNHGYVARKVAWQIIPVTITKRKRGDGDIGTACDWSSRVTEGLELDIEEPDMYIPLMSFVTYVLLCGIVSGLHGRFEPGVLSSTASFAIAVLCLEVGGAKAALYMSGATTAPALDILALIGYTFMYLSFSLLVGLLSGVGGSPGILYRIFLIGMMASCGSSSFQTLRCLPKMRPPSSMETYDLHGICIKVLSLTQAVLCWLLMPTWPTATMAPAALAVADHVGGAAAALQAADLAKLAADNL